MLALEAAILGAVTCKMAMIVRLSFVITQPFHRVALRNMLGVISDELLRTIPYRWNGLGVLVQTKYEAVLLIVFGHVPEWIEVNVTEKFDAWLDTPVPLVLLHQWLSEEEPRFESAHVSVACRVTVDDLPFSHVLPDFAGFVLVDEFWERPMLLWYLAITGLSRYQGRSDFLEVLIKFFVVQKYPVVVVIPVKSIFYLAD